MTTKYTPGPWAYWRGDDFGDARFYIAQADGAPYTPNYSDVATLVAETVSSERVLIQEANARLIAAAPDLLESLKQALAALQSCDPGDTNSGYVVYPSFDEGACSRAEWAAMAAILKATGEQA